MCVMVTGVADGRGKIGLNKGGDYVGSDGRG
jgi:hypothetical protein